MKFARLAFLSLVATVISLSLAFAPPGNPTGGNTKGGGGGGNTKGGGGGGNTKGGGGGGNTKGGGGGGNTKGGGITNLKGGVIHPLGGGRLRINHLAQPALRTRILANVPVLAGTPGVVVQAGGNNLVAEDEVPKEYGMEITDMRANGIGAKANLQVGHIIVMADNQRTQSFEELSDILAKADKPIEVVVIDPTTSQLAKTTLLPTNGKIGVSVVAVGVE